MTIAKESESSANHDTDPVQQSAAFESESARRFEASQLTHETSTQSEHIDELQSAASVIKRLVEAVRCKVLGRDEIIELCVIALLADGHVLLEDFPGSGKTTLAKTLGEAINSQLAKPAEVPLTVVFNASSSPLTCCPRTSQALPYSIPPTTAFISARDRFSPTWYSPTK